MSAADPAGMPRIAGHQNDSAVILANHYRHSPRPPSPPPPSKRSNLPLPSQQAAYTSLTTTSSSLPDAAAPSVPTEKHKPNYAPTGLLAAETNTITNPTSSSKPIVLKYHEPPTARLPPPSISYLLYTFKPPAPEPLSPPIKLHTRTCWLLGRQALVADIPLEHPSISGQHAVLQFRYVRKKDEFGEEKGKVRLYVLDLESANGSLLNGEGVPGGRYVEVRGGDVLRWGESGREYVLLVTEGEGKG
ncbi:MAG: hypothetical protein Q9220_006376 [cf. Caloplaca sp. 1 TL-2023]